MIVKHVPIRSLKKSNFSSLVKYITDEQNKTNRLGMVNITNCETDSMQAAISEVLATQQINKRAKSDKTYHLIVSFPTGEKPENNILKEIEKYICSELGYADHQRISAVHHDTDNVHMHIAINKIHPNKNTIHDPYKAYITLGRLCDVIEDKYGLKKDNHQIVKSVSQGRASDMEQHAGIESLINWIKRECLEEIRTANTWEELHRVMNNNGLEIRQKANGFVIKSNNGVIVKASSVARDLSKSKLESKLGVYEKIKKQSEHQEEKKQYKKKPIHFNINTTDLYTTYQKEQENLTYMRKVEWNVAKRKKDQRIEAIKRSNRLRRSVIKLMGGSRLTKKILYMQAYKKMKDEIDLINKEYKQNRQISYEYYKRRTWADWLKQQALNGDNKSLEALRSRNQVKKLQGYTIKGEGKVKLNHNPQIDNITKKGTIIFRTRNSAVRDDGDKLQVSKKATVDVVTEALRIAINKYGNQITVNGSPQFKAQVIHAAAYSNLLITFTDTSLEHRRQQLLKQILKQENNNDQRNKQIRRNNERGRIDRRSFGRVGETVTNNRKYDDPNSNRTGNNIPNITSIGREPPPFAKNCLRPLSLLSVVRFSRRSEVLLSNNVLSELEHNGTKLNNKLRWGISKLEKTEAENINAANKYIIERENKRLLGFDIPKHMLYTNQNNQYNEITYGGTRNVQGQSLVLLNKNNEVLVLPVDKATAQRMKKIRIGDAVKVTPQGSLKKIKGMSK